MSLSSSSRGGRRQSVDSFSDRSFQTAYQDLDLISHEARRGSLPSLPDSEDLQERSVPPARRPRGFFHFFESAHTNNPFRSLSVCANPRTRSLESEPRSLSQNNSPRKQNPAARIFFPQEQVQNAEQCQQSSSLEATSADFLSLTKTLEFMLECKICSHVMKPPIYHCLNGHDICSSCRTHIDICPTCHTGYSGGRNFIAEEIFANIFNHCRYRDQGCSEMLLDRHVATHESTCVYRVCECRFFFPDRGACDWTGLKADLAEHVKQVHKIQLCELNVVPMTIVSIHRQFQHCYLKVSYGELFWWHYKRDPNLGVFEVLQYIGPPDKARSFMYAITYAHPTRIPSIKFSDFACTIDDDFQTLCDQRKCLFISIDVFERMCEGNTVNFKFQIIKLHD